MSDTAAPPQFWVSSGHDLLDHDANGHLGISADFIRAYLSRPEMLPPEEACAAERALHAALLDDPLQAVDDARLAALADPDARQNYVIFLRFRDHLAKAGTVERAYLNLFREGAPAVPAMFIDHLAAAILRDALQDGADAFRARAAELFFRCQKATIRDGSILLADEETVEMLAAGQGFGSLGAWWRRPARRCAASTWTSCQRRMPAHTGPAATATTSCWISVSPAPASMPSPASSNAGSNG